MRQDAWVQALTVALLGWSCWGCGDRSKSHRSGTGPSAQTTTQSTATQAAPTGASDDHGDSYGTATKLGNLLPPRTDRYNPQNPLKPIEHYSPVQASDVGVLDRSVDTDWFEGLLKDRITYTVEALTKQDTHITVLDPAGQVVGEADSVTPQDGSARLTFVAQRAGHHYVVIRKGDASRDRLANPGPGGDLTLQSWAGNFEADDPYDYTVVVRSRSYNAP